jgi:hypothetical protein
MASAWFTSHHRGRGVNMVQHGIQNNWESLDILDERRFNENV